MSPTWQGDDPPPLYQPQSARDWFRVIRRGVPMITLIVTGLLLKFVMRLIERPLFGMRRPVTPYITTAVCKGALWCMGLRLTVRGRPMRHPGASVANHASWLDIFVLNATRRLYFVSKSEVAFWPGIGWLARATGTVFISRDRREAKVQTELFRQRLLAGHQLMFFPEGTSTDTLRVLPFKPTLFAAFFDDSLRHEMHIQPVTVAYHPPEGRSERFYGWWGDMDFGPHLLAMLATPHHGSAEVIYHAPVRVDDFPNRKTLARAVEITVRDALHQARPDLPVS